ncbi:MAG: lipid II flippase MurJ [Vicinamibacterales bacterium]
MTTRGDVARGSALVALGSLVSRLAGLLRERALAQYLGTSIGADVFAAATRIPALLPLVLGDAAATNAFVPGYARAMSARGPAAADRLAREALTWASLGAVGAAGALAVLAPVLVGAVAGGLPPAAAAATVDVVRLLSAAAGLTVVASWAAAVATANRRYLLAQSLPMVTALAVIAALVFTGAGADSFALARAAAVGAVVGAGLQALCQLAHAGLLTRGAVLRPSATWAEAGAIASTTGRVALHGGLLRLGIWVETAIASFLPTGALATMTYGQLIAGLPVVLVAAATSTALMAPLAADVGAGRLESARTRLQHALEQVAYFAVPSAAAFLVMGDRLAAAVYEGGRFTAANAVDVWWVLGASAVGLTATTTRSIYASAFYAFADAATPLSIAAWRLGARATLALLLGLALPWALDLPAGGALAGLILAGGTTSWLELHLLRRALGSHVAGVGLGRARLARLWSSAGLGGGVVMALRSSTSHWAPPLDGLALLGAFGAVYVVATRLLDVAPDAWRTDPAGRL